MDNYSMIIISEDKQRELVRQTNSFANRFSLSLSEKDVEELILQRRECLSRQQRVEFGAGILKKLIFAFCDSPYIYQDNYTETLERLQEIFYRYKEESMDEWPDDELIEQMKKDFDGKCQGSLEYLEGTCLEKCARKIRAKKRQDNVAYETVEQRGWDWYPPEELLPIVAKLTEEYTGRDSSSVSYDKAKQLMDAVIFCIAHSADGGSKNMGVSDVFAENDGESANYIVSSKGIPAAEAYWLGYRAVVRKVQRTILKYNQLMRCFDDYGNRNYGDTVRKAIPGFFRYYDPKFAPLETIITMDYPIFWQDLTLHGIDRIAEYLDAIAKEQQFLMQYERAEVIEMLRIFHPRYEGEFFNLKEIVTGQSSDNCFLHERSEKDSSIEIIDCADL